jgi:endo-1,4-beta-mannosidase
MYWWSNFDRGEVEEEFAVIRDLGLTVVRLFLLWDDFQPTPDTISKAALEHLIAVCDVAEANGLRLNITFFTGHMSGPNWPARWMLDDSGAVDSPRPLALGGRLIAQRRYLDPYTDPIALRAEELLIRTVVGALKDHPAVWLWNLGNEADLFAAPATPQIGRDWTRRMVALIREIDPAHPVTFGLHTDSLLLENGLHPDQVYGETDIAVMHGYPMYQSWLPSPLDTNFVPFACALTAANPS